jgi:hypothetical protein
MQISPSVLPPTVDGSANDCKADVLAFDQNKGMLTFIEGDLLCARKCFF